MTGHPLPRANDDSAARLLLAEHAEERGDVRMAMAWRWMACMAKWPQVGAGWWPDDYEHNSACHRLPTLDENDDLFAVFVTTDCESALADALERGDL